MSTGRIEKATSDEIGITAKKLIELLIQSNTDIDKNLCIRIGNVKAMVTCVEIEGNNIYLSSAFLQDY